MENKDTYNKQVVNAWMWSDREVRRLAKKKAQKRAKFQAQWQAESEKRAREKAKAKAVVKAMRVQIVQNVVQGAKLKPKVHGMELLSSFLLLIYILSM